MWSRFLAEPVRRFALRLVGERSRFRYPPPRGDHALILARWLREQERPDPNPCQVSPWSLIVWAENGRLSFRCAPGDDAPDRITQNGREYRPFLAEDTLLFWGALKDTSGRLVGFDIHIVKDPPILSSPFVTETRGVWVEPSPDRPFSLMLMLVESLECTNEGTEGFPVQFYSDGRGEVLLWFGAMEMWVGSPEAVGFEQFGGLRT